MPELPEIVKNMGYLLPQKISAILRLKDVFAKFKVRSYKKNPKYIGTKLPTMRQVCLKVFKDGLDLIMNDLIDNNITLKIPTYSDRSAELSILTKSVKKQTAGLYLTYITKNKEIFKSPFIVGETWRNRIDENVKNGKQYY